MPKLSTLAQKQTDPALKEAGVWQDIVIPDVPEPLRLKLRSMSSNRARTWDHLTFRKQRNYYIDDKAPPIEVLDQNECDKLADALVVDWDLTDDDGAPVPCTPDNVRTIMKQLPDVRFDAIVKANGKEKYRKAEVIALGGNSEPPSTPSSDTGAKAG